MRRSFSPADRVSQQAHIANIYGTVCGPKSTEMLGNKKERKCTQGGDPAASK